MVERVTPLPTIGEIARRFSVPVHRVRYVLDRLSVKPMGAAGIARVFSEDDVDRVGAELHRIDRERKAAAHD